MARSPGGRFDRSGAMRVASPESGRPNWLHRGLVADGPSTRSWLGRQGDALEEAAMTRQTSISTGQPQHQRTDADTHGHGAEPEDGDALPSSSVSQSGLAY